MRCDRKKKKRWNKQTYEAFVQEGIKRSKLQVTVAFIFNGVVISCLSVVGILVYILTKMGVTLNGLNYPLVIIWIVSSVCVCLSSLVSYYLVKKIFMPLEELSVASMKVAEGDFQVQVEYQGDLEEIGNTIENFNRMVKELNSVEIMRNDFVADVSHEFKTPLAAITGYTTFVQDPELTEEERNEYIRKIHFNVDKLNELTENILRLSKLEHQQFLEEPVSFRLDEQIREAIVLLEPKWGKKQTNFELQLPEIQYKGQKGLLFQVWMNMIGNAIKYTNENGIVWIALEEKANGYEILIRDNGIGMTKETVSHIFDKFYQGDTSRKSQGNGLGMALCKEVIQKCQGKIIVESKIGEGSLFTVQLPKSEKI